MKFKWLLWAVGGFIGISFFMGFILPYVPHTGNTLADSTIITALIVAPFVFVWEKYIRKRAGGV